MFKDVLVSVREDLSRIESLDKNEVFRNKVQNVLNVAYQSYCRSLKLNYDYLLYRDTLKVLRNIKREREKKHGIQCK